MGGFSVGNTLRITKVGRGGTTTVPHEVRKVLGVKEGDSIEWVYEDGRIVVRKAGEKHG